MDTFYKGVIAVAGEIAGFLFGGWSVARRAPLSPYFLRSFMSRKSTEIRHNPNDHKNKHFTSNADISDFTFLRLFRQPSDRLHNQSQVQTK